MTVALATPEVPESRREWAQYADELPDYWNRDVVPSVSQLLAWRYGGPPDFPAVQIAIDRGHKAHLAMQLYDEGDLDYDSIVGTEAEGYLHAWVGASVGEKFIAIEKPLWGDFMGVKYIAKPDRITDDAVMEIKTKGASGRRPNAEEKLRHGIQLAAQWIAAWQRLGAPPKHRCCGIYLWPNGGHYVEDYSEEFYLDALGKLIAEWKDAQEDW